MIKIELLVANGEVTVVAEGEKVTFRSIDDALAYVRKMATDVDCIRNSWYIRVPLVRILDTLAYASMAKSRSVKETLVNYLRERGLSETNVRVIEPTLQALNLVNNGEFTDDALRIGELYRMGMLSECASLMMKLAQGNCALRGLLSKYRPGDPDSLRQLGLRRRDEVNYTMQLLDFMISGGLLGCIDSLREFLNDKCTTPLCQCCTSYATYFILSRIPTAKLMDYLNLPNPGYTPVISGREVALVHPGSGDRVAVVGKVAEFNQVNYAPALRALVDSIEQELRRGGVDRAILIIPFTVNYNGCGVGKVYVATYLNGVFTYAEIHEPREFVNPGFK
ncbi:MAG: hypothetical protein RXR04_00960 [Caldivirga sp.]